MPYKFWKYARQVDADTMNFYTPNLVNALQIDVGTANYTKILGQSATGKYLTIYPNQTDTRPRMTFAGASNVELDLPATKYFTILENGTEILRIDYTSPDMIIESKIDAKDLYLATTGTGVLKFGTYTAGAATDSTGYISVKDAAGNARKLMVQA